jgi:hypothetical protein
MSKLRKRSEAKIFSLPESEANKKAKRTKRTFFSKLSKAKRSENKAKRSENKAKRSEAKRSEAKRSEKKRNENKAKRSEGKKNEAKGKKKRSENMTTHIYPQPWI